MVHHGRAEIFALPFADSPIRASCLPSLNSFSPSPQQDDRSALESDFVDGAGTFELVGASENHVYGRLSLRFEALQRVCIQRSTVRVDSIYVEVHVFSGDD